MLVWDVYFLFYLSPYSMVGYWGLGGTIMFLKNFVNAVVNAESTDVKVVGYTTLAAIGIGADILALVPRRLKLR